MEQLTSTANPRVAKRATILAKQKDGTLAAFYTRQDVAQILTDWALTGATCRVIDPSYGGCSFLKAAQTTLRNLGNLTPERQIFGVDIDQDAYIYLEDLIAAGANREQFLNDDFFNIGITYFGGLLFDAVVGNPPYLRYHSIPEKLQERASARLKEHGIILSGRASYWAYFLVYSMLLLRRGGRLAMVLPGAILHTDYAAQVRKLLTEGFKRVSIYLLQERIFDGTEEESVIVCAEGAGGGNGEVRICHVNSVAELADAVGGLTDNSKQVTDDTEEGDWLRHLLENDTLELYDDLATAANVIRLGDWVTSRIGVVTGKNSYFILSDHQRKESGIPKKYFRRVIRRPSYISGFAATNRDLLELSTQGKEYLLLYPPKDLRRTPKALRNYIEKGEESGVSLAWKCKSREPWYIVPHTDAPKAFMPCMAASWPRLIVNKSDYTCTNNILKLSWKEKRPASDWDRLALGTLSTLSQLSAELVGRSYGGGVLKLEPKELSRLAVPLLPLTIVSLLSEKVDALIRRGNLMEAVDAVDSALINADGRLLTHVQMARLRDARKKLFMRRRQHRRDADKHIQ
jgi:hypothetical protein